MDPDLNKYDLNHRVSHHPKMSDAEWEDAYRAAWKAYYTPEHLRTDSPPRRRQQHGRLNSTFSTILWFTLMITFEGVHPLEGGAFRMKFRRDRRYGLPIESPLGFYPRFLRDARRQGARLLVGLPDSQDHPREVKSAPDRWTYTDLAIAPPMENELESLDLYHATRGGEAALAKKRRDDAIRATAYAAAEHRVEAMRAAE